MQIIRFLPLVFIVIASRIDALDFYEKLDLKQIESEVVVISEASKRVNPWAEGQLVVKTAKYKKHTIELIYSAETLFCVHAAEVDYCIDLDGDCIIDTIQSEFILPYMLFRNEAKSGDPGRINTILDMCYALYNSSKDPNLSRNTPKLLEAAFSVYYTGSRPERTLAYFIYFDLFYARYLKPQDAIYFYNKLKKLYEDAYRKSDRYIYFRVFETSYKTRMIEKDSFDRLFARLKSVYDDSFYPFVFYSELVAGRSGDTLKQQSHWFSARYANDIRALPSSMFDLKMTSEVFHILPP